MDREHSCRVSTRYERGAEGRGEGKGGGKACEAWSKSNLTAHPAHATALNKAAGHLFTGAARPIISRPRA